MGRERLTRGLLLRVGVLLIALCLCVHVYLETRWRGPPAALVLGRPSRSSQDWGPRGRSEQISAEEQGQDRSIKRRISYVRTLKKNRTAGKRDEDGEEPSVQCCPPPHRTRKVTFHRLLRP